jgi:uncharacterized protein YgbK (DUF1537 family)
MVKLHVVADDRTGATETAAALADAGAGPVSVEVWPSWSSAAAVAVVDISSRNLDRFTAAERALSADRSGPSAHKIDSTLRGNWAHELVARYRLRGRPTLIVPALPSQGRTCVGGIVRADGTQMADPRTALEALGVADLGVARTVAGVIDWLDRPSGWLVADAADDGTIRAIVAAWADRDDVLLAGTSVVIGAVGLASHLTGAPAASAAMPTTAQPILVVCGSVNPAARAQIDKAAEAGIAVAQSVDERSMDDLRRSGSLILTTPPTNGPHRVEMARELADRAHRVLDQVDVGAVVMIGGDTASAVLGTETAIVYGSVGPGTAWLRTSAIDAPVVTRAGGFGSDNSLVDLLSATLRG